MITGAVTAGGTLTADAYVLALGVAAPQVARTIGVRLGIYPAKGYSSTFPIRADGLAPTVPGVDEQWLVGWSRQGDRLRLTSTAEFAGHDRCWSPRDFNNILRLARDLFPTAADWERGRVPRVSSAHDAGWPARPGDGAPSQSLLQRRPRAHGMDDGVRHGADRDGPGRRAEARSRPRGARASGGRRGALSLVRRANRAQT